MNFAKPLFQANFRS